MPSSHHHTDCRSCWCNHCHNLRYNYLSTNRYNLYTQNYCYYFLDCWY